MGQVSRPGPRNFSGRDRTLTAIAEAQPNSLAWQRMIQVVRPAAEEGAEPLVFSIDYKHMMATGDTSKDVLLQDGDIIYVPPTVLAQLGLVIEEFISPVARAFYGAYLVQNPPGSSQGYYPTAAVWAAAISGNTRGKSEECHCEWGAAISHSGMGGSPASRSSVRSLAMTYVTFPAFLRGPV